MRQPVPPHRRKADWALLDGAWEGLGRGPAFAPGRVKRPVWLLRRRLRSRRRSIETKGLRACRLRIAG